MAFDTLGEEKINRLVRDEKDKRVFCKSVLIYGNPKTKEIRTFIGVYEGMVAEKAREKQLTMS